MQPNAIVNLGLAYLELYREGENTYRLRTYAEDGKTEVEEIDSYLFHALVRYELDREKRTSSGFREALKGNEERSINRWNEERLAFEASADGVRLKRCADAVMKAHEERLKSD